jgi:hypothetical protein
MQVTYCRRWNFMYNQPIDPLTGQQARKRDEKGELYTAVLGDPVDPVLLVEVQRPHIRVVFFDQFQRQLHHFDFRRHDDKTLFLHEITNWVYPDDQFREMNEASVITSARFDPPDLSRVEIRDKVAGEVKEKKYREVDLGPHWEPVPEFGDWLSIARYEREKPVSEQFWAPMLDDDERR